MIDTKEKILDVALELMQTRGFIDMTFQDIAQQVGIKKPSIIYHFSSKSALGQAVIERYHSNFQNALNALDNDPSQSYWDMLEFYFTPYRQFSKMENRVCLCGALAGEFLALPVEIQDIVKQFFSWHQDWLTRIFTSGRNAKEFKYQEDPERLAKTFFSALQGALLVKRATGDPDQLEQVILTIKKHSLAHNYF